MNLLQVCTYAASAVFAAGCIYKGVKIANAPAHLRWELYPVPHEKGKAGYGGSMAEEPDFWEKEQKKDYFGEIACMAKEILLLHGVRSHNKPLWRSSYPMHFGLYIVMANVFLAIVSAILVMAGAGGSALQAAILSVIPLMALGAGVLGSLGAIFLLARRLTDPKLKNFSTPSHFFNLALLAAIFISGLAWLATDAGFAAREVNFIVSCLTGAEIQMPAAAQVHVIFALIFLVYMPFTHMTHLFTKYFTYHKVRWDDEANKKGSRLNTRLQKQLRLPVSWSARHIGADGRKTWLDIAAGMPGEEKNAE